MQFWRYACTQTNRHTNRHTHTHTRLTALLPGLPGWADTRKAKPNWILLKQETVSGSGIGWAICKSAPRSRQITMPAPHYSIFYRPDALPAAQPTASKHWRQLHRQTDIHINKQKYNTDILITTPHSLLAAEQQNTHSLKAFKKSTVCTSNVTLTSDKQ